MSWQIRRISSSAASSSPERDIEPPDGEDEGGSPKARAEDFVGPEIGPFRYWYGGDGNAYRQADGRPKEAHVGEPTEDANGFLVFKWPNGDTFFSDEPALPHVPASAKAKAKAKAKSKAKAKAKAKAKSKAKAKAKAKPKAAGAAYVWKVPKPDMKLLKLRVTREYHRAQNAYKNECKAKGVAVNAADMRTYTSKKVHGFKSDVAAGVIKLV